MPHEDYCYALERENHALNEEIESLRQRLAGANARIELMGETALNQQKREVMLRDALEYHQAQTRPIQKTEEALAIQPDDAALKDKAMTTYEQPKDWIERHLVEDPGGLLACEPSGLNEELKLARQANEFQHQTIKKQAAQIATMRETALNQQKREVMLRDALESMSALGVMAIYNGSPHWIFPIKVMHRADEALAATDDLDGLILCDAVEVGWIGTGPRDRRCEFSESKPANSVMRDFNLTAPRPKGR